jgi:hypothetical protein
MVELLSKYTINSLDEDFEDEDFEDEDFEDDWDDDEEE